MAPDATVPLRLRARDADDLAVLSAALQDAIVPVHDITFLRRERSFVMAVNRFRWEAPAQLVDGQEFWQRTLCGVRFQGVESVQSRKLDLQDRGRMLDLLAVTAEEGGLLLSFAGDVALRLAAPAIDVMLEDRGEPWPTPQKPQHPE
ncbi:DUF2948 family protein [Inquilinus limosus]|uniref:DUF2948 domain-containing protein n=1 Tax=Inquilinus limosus MP06 TaxID=1398085 RepID=A0A0A0D1V8_9PROT|nr:DUF2948 family protein [Inquilinus limosus]KGM32044.1 hypothetical protein P409_23685 [Inquilinus limosus MP06]